MPILLWNHHRNKPEQTCSRSFSAAVIFDWHYEPDPTRLDVSRITGMKRRQRKSLPMPECGRSLQLRIRPVSRRT